jgi:hypothetical protein
MAERRGLAAVGRFVLFVALLNVVMLVVIGLVCWFGGWRTLGDFGNGLTYAGLLVMAAGGMRYFGGIANGANPTMGLHSTNLREHHNRVVRAMGERDSAFVGMLKFGTGGLVAMALGQLLRAVVL